MYDKISYEFSQGKEIIIFCARGGMRSLSVHNLFNSIGIKNYKLDRGYKGYRKFLRDKLPELLKKINFIVIHGKTGIGKTKILNILDKQGYPIIDLEKAANHRASFLGGVNLGEQNSQKQFESIIFHKLMEISMNEKFNNGCEKINVFIEGESKRIGKIIIPECIFNAMNDGVHICVDLPVEIRVKNLMEDYFKVSEEDFNINNFNIEQYILDDFEKSLILLKKYASEKQLNDYLNLFYQKKYIDLAKYLIESYYDPKYMKSMNKHNFKYNINCISNEDFLFKMEKIYLEI